MAPSRTKGILCSAAEKTPTNESSNQSRSLVALSPDTEELLGFGIERCRASWVQGEHQRAVDVELADVRMTKREQSEVSLL